MIRCIIIDDEPLAIELLLDHISKAKGIDCIGSFSDPIEGLHSLTSLKPDLIFLDVQMPELTGIQFLKITKGTYPVVLTTAYQEYALSGYDWDVIDYLLKPITLDRFLKCVEKIRNRLEPASIEIQRLDHIFVKSEYKTVRIDLAEVLYLEGMGDYVAIHTMDKKVLTLDTLRNFEVTLLNHSFARVHKSYIINIAAIDHIERNRIVIGNRYIPLSATYEKEFRERIKFPN